MTVEELCLEPPPLMELIPVPNPDKGGGLGMKLATPSCRKITHSKNAN